jgi:hypothetical protein
VSLGLKLGLHYFGLGCSAVSVRPMSVVKLGMGVRSHRLGVGFPNTWSALVRLLLPEDM